MSLFFIFIYYFFVILFSSFSFLFCSLRDAIFLFHFSVRGTFCCSNFNSILLFLSSALSSSYFVHFISFHFIFFIFRLFLSVPLCPAPAVIYRLPSTTYTHTHKLKRFFFCWISHFEFNGIAVKLINMLL